MPTTFWRRTTYQIRRGNTYEEKCVLWVSHAPIPKDGALALPNFGTLYKDYAVRPRTTKVGMVAGARGRADNGSHFMTMTHVTHQSIDP